jgi:hypothetical protein
MTRPVYRVCQLPLPSMPRTYCGHSNMRAANVRLLLLEGRGPRSGKVGTEALYCPDWLGVVFSGAFGPTLSGVHFSVTG